MNRFLKTLTLLVASLFVVVSGVDAALDQLSHATAQSSYTLYNEKGEIVVAYSGGLASFRTNMKPVAAVTPNFLHRT